MAQATTRRTTGGKADDGQAQSGLVIPNVTEDELLAFQLAHFSDDTIPATWFVDAETALGYDGDHDEDDGLGYYADGVKRTLMDEQVAIFRNSEIQKLVREERLRREEEAERASNTEVAERTSSKSPTSDAPSPEFNSTAHAQPVGAHQSSVRDGDVDNRSRSTGSAPPNRQPRSRQSDVPYDQRHKRKWEGYIEDTDPREGSLTHRRIVRELDQAGEESVDLDY